MVKYLRFQLTVNDHQMTGLYIANCLTQLTLHFLFY